MKTASPRSPRRGLGFISALAGILLAGSPRADAVTLLFEQITSNSPTDYSPYLSADVLDFGTGALFTVSLGPTSPDGFINQIYFEDLASVFDGMTFENTLSPSPVTAVDYVTPTSPSSPPGVNPFVADHGFGAVNPAPTYGIDPDEGASFLAIYAPGMSFGNVEQALVAGDLRVALHMQGLDPGAEESDSYLNVTPKDPRIPEPGTALLTLLGTVLLLRRRNR